MVYISYHIGNRPTLKKIIIIIESKVTNSVTILDFSQATCNPRNMVEANFVSMTSPKLTINLFEIWYCVIRENFSHNSSQVYLKFFSLCIQ